MILNPKSMQPLYTIAFTDIEKLSTSPYADGIVVVHMKEVSHAVSRDAVLFCAMLYYAFLCYAI